MGIRAFPIAVYKARQPWPEDCVAQRHQGSCSQTQEPRQCAALRLQGGRDEPQGEFSVSLERADHSCGIFLSIVIPTTIKMYLRYGQGVSRTRLVQRRRGDAIRCRYACTCVVWILAKCFFTTRSCRDTSSSILSIFICMAESHSDTHRLPKGSLSNRFHNEHGLQVEGGEYRRQRPLYQPI